MSQSKRTPGALRRARTSDSLWCAERCAPATSRVAVRRWPAAGQRACHAHEWFDLESFTKMNQTRPNKSSAVRPTLQFSADRPILNPDQRRLILRREVASSVTLVQRGLVSRSTKTRTSATAL